MASAMSSQGVILTTAMAVSGALIYLSLSAIGSFQLSAIHPLYKSHLSNSSSSLRSCLSSGEKNRREKNKKKRVKFSDRVMVQLIH